MNERRGQTAGRRVSDFHHDVAIEAAKEAARVVTAAGVVELADEVRKLRKAFGDYGAVLEAKLHRRWRLVVIATILAGVIVCGFGYTLFVIDRSSHRSLFAACEQRKQLEDAILNVIRPGIDQPREPGETVVEYQRRQDGLREAAAKIESPPCSEQVE